MKMKKIVIFAIILFIILIIGISIAIKHLENNPENILEELGEEGEIIDYENQETQKVTDFIKFYTVVNCVDTYMNIINIDSTSYYGRDENDNYAIIFSDEEINKNIYNLLSKEYIEDNGITIENLRDKIEVLDKQVIFVPLKMNVLINSNIERYVVYGFLTDMQSNFIKETYLYVNLDVVNKSFSIEPISNKEIKNIDEIEIVNNNNPIEENDVNLVNESKISNEYLCQKYIDSYKRILLSYPKLAYEYLEDGYKQERFGSYEEFEKYIQNNIDDIKKIALKEYLVNYYDEYTEYVCKDKYDNLYIFDEKSVLEYTIKLDTYTIPTTKFKETYNSSEDYKKVQMNIDKFFQMMNRHDYKTSYECLAESYKNNYFKTEEEFANFAKNNLFAYNKVTYKDYEQKGSGLYVFNIELTDLTEEDANVKKVTIVMQLNEDLDFEMSFSM